jgi:DUF3048 family protein/tetratricopeptide repeat protein
VKQLMPEDKIDSDVVASQDSLAVGAGGVAVKGNVEGDIQVTNKKVEVHADHGAVVSISDALPRVKQRDALPQPPRSIRGFVNRTNELKRLDQSLAKGEAVVIQGIDGVGKSALLRQTANSNTARAMPHGVVFMEGLDESGLALGFEDVIQRLFDKLFESEPHLKVNFDTAQTYLSNTKPLVILDGLQIPAPSLSRITDLFPRGAVLMESNHPIDNDTVAVIELGSLPRHEAIELLAAEVGLSPDDSTRPKLDSLCELLADVPLAIIKAARTIRENHIPPERAYAVLESIKSPSDDKTRVGIERAYTFAYSTLTVEERQFLAAAALAPGISSDPQWLRQVAGERVSTERAQERLQAMGLLTANSPRLRIDPGFRDLARQGTDEILIKEQLISYLKKMLETRSLDWKFCAAELGNILGMIDWAAKHEHWADAISLGRAIDPYLTLHGFWEAWRMMIDNVLQSARELGDHANEAWALHQLGTHAIGIGQADQATKFFRQALDLRRALGDTMGAAYTQHNLDLLIPPAGNGRHGSSNKPKGGKGGGRPWFMSGSALMIALVTASIFISIALSQFGHSDTPAPKPTITFAPIASQTSTTPDPTITVPTKTFTLTPVKPTISPIPMIGPDDFPSGINPLTGLPACDPELLKFPAVLVSITDFPASARPQAGLSFSPMVFEIFIGEGATRFLAVFYGDCPHAIVPDEQGRLTSHLGPIRSGRLPYAYIRDSFQWSCLVFASATEELFNTLRGCKLVYGSDAKDINSAFLDVTKMKEIAQANVKPNQPFNYTGNLFSDAVPAEGKSAHLLNVTYSWENQAQWTYDPALGEYLRSENLPTAPLKFDPATDRLTGQQLAFSNIIVLLAKHTVVKSGIIDIDIGAGTGGDAFLFRDGQAFKIRWTTLNGEYEKKFGLRRPIRFLDEAGNPIALKPGNTWIHVMNVGSSIGEESPGNWQLNFYKPPGSN